MVLRSHSFPRLVGLGVLPPLGGWFCATRECRLGVMYCTMHLLRNAGGKGVWETSVVSYNNGVCWREASCVLPLWVNGVGRS